MNDLRCLLCTHHLLDYSGSEVVVLELAEELLQRGCHVSLFSPFQNDQFLAAAVPSGVAIIPHSTGIDLRQFDLVYCQHQSISPMLAAQDLGYLLSTSRPVFVYNHLSPIEPFEAPGPFAEKCFADIIMCNSAETQQSLARFGTSFENATIFPNPAPIRFSATPRPRSTGVSRLISVSNHIPEELSGAFEILEAEGVVITRIGRGSGQKKLELEDLTANDAVVTIGKTVQYAIRAKLPIFCYDRFAGPGWLTEGNFDSAAFRNFSGRCSQKARTPEELSREIREGLSGAKVFSYVPEHYCLEKMVDQIIRSVRACAEARVPIKMQPKDIMGPLEIEKSIYRLVDREYKNKKAAIDANASRTGKLERHLEAAMSQVKLLQETQVASEKERNREFLELKRNLLDARLRPMKSLRRKWMSQLMYFLSKRERFFFERQRKKFHALAQKRDPRRDDIASHRKRLD